MLDALYILIKFVYNNIFFIRPSILKNNQYD